MLRFPRLIAFVLLFVAPLAVLSAYMLAYATDRFDSEAAIIIAEERGAASGGLDLSAIGLAAPAGQRDPLVLSEFILSPDMLRHLEKRLGLKAHYSATNLDWWSRLPPSYSFEDFHDYMGRYLRVRYDGDAQMLRLHVEAFDRAFARDTMAAILERSQEFIDRLNDKVASGQMQFFEQKLVETERRLAEARGDLVEFQTRNRIMSTETEAAKVSANIGELEKALLAKEGERASRLSVLAVTSPTVQVLTGEIETLKDQIDTEKDRLSGGSSVAVNELDAKFREIQGRVEFAAALYTSNLTQLEQARVSAAQRLKYLVVVTEPSLAEASLYPNRGFIIGTAALVLFMFYFIVSLIVAIIREHV